MRRGARHPMGKVWRYPLARNPRPEFSSGSPVNPPSTLSAPHSVLLAVAPRELDEFLPPPLVNGIRALFADVRSCNPATLDPADWPALLERERPGILVTCWQTPPLPARLPDSLRYVCHLGGSTRRLVQRQHLEQGLLVTNWGPSVARGVAEGALTLILAALHRAGHWAIRLHVERGWRTDADRVESLHERTVGIHGFGFVARELVRLIQPFGNPVAVYAPGTPDALIREHRVAAAPSLEALFAGNDVVVELAPLIPATHGIVTEKLLRSMPPGALFVNVARGPIVEEAGLLRVAAEGRLLVALDVYQTEPLPADSPLRGLPNVTLFPHVAGPTNDRRRDAGAFALENLRAYSRGLQPAAVVTPAIYDQAT